MAANWMRRTVLSSVAAASVALLAACGSSSVANSIKPDSLVTFGDALSEDLVAHGLAPGSFHRELFEMR